MTKKQTNTTSTDSKNAPATDSKSGLMPISILQKHAVSVQYNTLGCKKNKGQKVYTEFDAIKGEYIRTVNCKEGTVEVYSKGSKVLKSSWSLTGVENTETHMGSIEFYAVYDVETGRQVWACKLGTLPRGLGLSEDDIRTKYEAWLAERQKQAKTLNMQMRPLTEFARYQFRINSQDLFSVFQMQMHGSLQITKYEAVRNPGKVARLQAENEVLAVAYAKLQAQQQELASLTSELVKCMLAGNREEASVLQAKMEALNAA